MLLRQNGAALIREDALYKIVPVSIASRGSVTPHSAGRARRFARFSVLPVRYIGAKEMAT
jgi:hypothetical protein